jgi:hypothetical protein
VLEPCEAKVSRTVLRGLGLREGARLLGEARPWSAVSSGAKVGGARVRKSCQKEAGGAADAVLMQIEWSEGEVLKLE